jgi:hypothetical protein
MRDKPGLRQCRWQGADMQNVTGENMKDVKVDVRVNVSVDAASVVLLLASASMAAFFFRQQKHQKQNKQDEQEKLATPAT